MMICTCTRSPSHSRPPYSSEQFRSPSRLWSNARNTSNVPSLVQQRRRCDMGLQQLIRHHGAGFEMGHGPWSHGCHIGHPFHPIPTAIHSIPSPRPSVPSHPHSQPGPCPLIRRVRENATVKVKQAGPTLLSAMEGCVNKPAHLDRRLHCNNH